MFGEGHIPEMSAKDNAIAVNTSDTFFRPKEATTMTVIRCFE